MKLRKITAILLSVMISAGSVYAHPGRTDSNGGHHDYKNKSGLGSYHYHCGGYPAHLHPNGVLINQVLQVHQVHLLQVVAVIQQLKLLQWQKIQIKTMFI